MKHEKVPSWLGMVLFVIVLLAAIILVMDALGLAWAPVS